MAEDVSSNGNVECHNFVTAPTFNATACKPSSNTQSLNDFCTSTFCSQPAGIAYGYPVGCNGVGTDITGPAFPVDGICRPFNSSNEASATYTQRWNDCTKAPGGAFCSSLTPNGNTISQCVPVSTVPAITGLLPQLGTRDDLLDISAFKLNDPTCATSGATATYQIATGSIGTVVASSTSTPLVVSSGFASIGETCGNDECTPSVDRIRLALKDQTAAGNSISGVTVENVGPVVLPGIGDVDSGLHSIPKGGITLLANGLVNGTPANLVLQNNGTFLAGGTASKFGLQGALDTVVTDATGHLLPISIPISVTGTPASAQVQGCLALSARDRLFGFEDVTSWTGTNAVLSLVTTPITQGCGALGINGQGYMPFTSSIFNTAALPVKAALSVDLFIPQTQPNPSWLGALQMYLTCPDANIFNQYIGQAELTGHPRNAYSTLRYPLPSASLSTLSQTVDCSFGFALNVNQTNQTWILDNLRFTP